MLNGPRPFAAPHPNFFFGSCSFEEGGGGRNSDGGGGGKSSGGGGAKSVGGGGGTRLSGGGGGGEESLPLRLAGGVAMASPLVWMFV
jgi:hypothetical protein